MRVRLFVRLPPGLKTMAEAVAWAEANHLVGFEAHSSPDGTLRGSGEVEVSDEDSNNNERTA